MLKIYRAVVKERNKRVCFLSFPTTLSPSALALEPSAPQRILSSYRRCQLDLESNAIHLGWILFEQGRRLFNRHVQEVTSCFSLKTTWATCECASTETRGGPGQKSSSLGFWLRPPVIVLSAMFSPCSLRLESRAAGRARNNMFICEDLRKSAAEYSCS